MSFEQRYYAFWLRVAAAILRGDYEIVAVLCHPNQEGKCIRDHEIVLTRGDQIKGYVENGLAPVVFAAPAGDLPKALADLERDDIFWMGDTARDGHVICGELLAWMVEGVVIEPEH